MFTRKVYQGAQGPDLGGRWRVMRVDKLWPMLGFPAWEGGEPDGR